MVKFFYLLFVLLALAAAAAAARFYERGHDDLSPSEVKQIEKLIQQLQLSETRYPKSVNHGRPDYRNKHHHHRDENDHDFTNIQTLNLVFKHNNIGSKPIARLGVDTDLSIDDNNNRLCEPGTRCGCRGRVGGPCKHDHTDDIIFLDGNLDDAETKLVNYVTPHENINLDSNQIGKKYSSNDNDAIENLLDDLEQSLINENEELEKGVASIADGNDPRVDKNVVKFLDDLEKTLVKGTNDRNDRDDDEDDENRYLRCCKNCVMRSFFRTDDDASDNDKDGKSYLRCCKKCGKRSKRSYRTSVITEPKPSNKEKKREDDDKAFLRCCKNCLRRSMRSTNWEWDLNNIRDDEKAAQKALRCYENCNRVNIKRNYRIDDREPNDEITEPKDKAAIYQLNDDLDAVVLDVSEIDNVLKLLNNGNNLDNANSFRDYLRAGSVKLVPKVNTTPNTSKTLLPLTLKQREKLMNRMRVFTRRNAPDDRFGLPFELDVQGLGQANA